MASFLCKTTVLKVYQDVIEDLIHGVRELFLDDGIDEQVLQELKQTWEAKLLASKAVEKERIPKQNEVTNGANGFPIKPQQQAEVVKQVVGQVPPNNHVQTPIALVVENKMVPIQITRLAQPGSDVGQKVLTIQVPASVLQGNQLHKLLTEPVITAAMSLPEPLASSVLQQHVNAALNSQQQAIIIGSIVNNPVIQTDGALYDESSNSEEEVEVELVTPNSNPSDLNDDEYEVKILETSPVVGPSSIKQGPSLLKAKSKRCTRICKVTQLDGETDDDKDEEEQEMHEEGPEEEPLNSEDDIADEDPSDPFDTENVVVCQYEKITRNRNKWKFHLKDGIMNLNGIDYVFQMTRGDAEW